MQYNNLYHVFLRDEMYNIFIDLLCKKHVHLKLHAERYTMSQYMSHFCVLLYVSYNIISYVMFFYVTKCIIFSLLSFVKNHVHLKFHAERYTMSQYMSHFCVSTLLTHIWFPTLCDNINLQYSKSHSSYQQKEQTRLITSH